LPAASVCGQAKQRRLIDPATRVNAFVTRTGRRRRCLRWLRPWDPDPSAGTVPALPGRFLVDRPQHDTTSILATIEHRFGLKPLGSRDVTVRDLSTVYKAQGSGGGD
jgi:hypothetical protein